jgi:DNA end-binding protein Ku
VPQREGRTRRRERLGAEEEAPRENGERATGRGIWSGSITFGLVTVPVELYTAHRRGGPSFRMLGPSGTPLVRRYFCPSENVALEPDEIVRGYPVGENEYVLVGDDELEALAPRRSRDIELTRFVPRDAVDPAYFVRAYFLVPGAEQTKAYRLLAETMESTGRAALATFVMRDKAYAVAIFADRGILRAETLRFGDEVRSAKAVGLEEAEEASPSGVSRMKKAIDALAQSKLDEKELQEEQDGGDRVLELAREKRKRGVDVVEVPEAIAAAAASEDGEEDGEATSGGGGDVVDLMALLKSRLRAPEGRPAEPKKGKAAATGTRVRAPAKRKGGAKEAAATESEQDKKPSKGKSRARKQSAAR